MAAGGRVCGRPEESRCVARKGFCGIRFPQTAIQFTETAILRIVDPSGVILTATIVFIHLPCVIRLRVHILLGISGQFRRADDKKFILSFCSKWSAKIDAGLILNVNLPYELGRRVTYIVGLIIFPLFCIHRFQIKQFLKLRPSNDLILYFEVEFRRMWNWSLF